MTYWWLSFADPRRPEGEQFLGVVILKTEAATSRAAWLDMDGRGLNLGGEVLIAQLAVEPEDKWCNRTLDPKETELATAAVNELSRRKVN